jgi:predicted nucleotidyltransferase
MESAIDMTIPREFKRRAEAALPGRVARVVLFGSRARGDAQADSDWDLAVFLRDGATTDDLCQLADAAYDLIVEHQQFIQPVAIADESADDDLALLRRIREEGIPV